MIAALFTGLYLNLSAGWADGLVTVYQERLPYESPWFNAQIELGYQYKSIELFAQHTSSPFTGEDHGVNFAGVRVRIQK